MAGGCGTPWESTSCAYATRNVYFRSPGVKTESSALNILESVPAPTAGGEPCRPPLPSVDEQISQTEFFDATDEALEPHEPEMDVKRNEGRDLSWNKSG